MIQSTDDADDAAATAADAGNDWRDVVRRSVIFE